MAGVVLGATVGAGRSGTSGRGKVPVGGAAEWSTGRDLMVGFSFMAGFSVLGSGGRAEV